MTLDSEGQKVKKRVEESCVESPEMTADRGGRADLKGLAERYDRLLRIEQSDWLSWGVTLPITY